LQSLPNTLQSLKKLVKNCEIPNKQTQQYTCTLKLTPKQGSRAAPLRLEQITNILGLFFIIVLTNNGSRREELKSIFAILFCCASQDTQGFIVPPLGKQPPG
jgi:hypothetical protein